MCSVAVLRGEEVAVNGSLIDQRSSWTYPETERERERESEREGGSKGIH